MTTPCPTCGHEPDAAAQTNSAGDLPLTVPEALIPAMCYAISYAYTRAKMCHGDEAAVIFEELQKTLRAAKPRASAHFEDYQWAALLDRLATGNDITIEFAYEGNYYRRDFHVRITDTTGKAWPKGTWNDPAVMTSPKFDEEIEAQELCHDLKEIQDRLRPI